MSMLRQSDLSSLYYSTEKRKVKYFIYTVDKPCGKGYPSEFKKRLHTFEEKDSEDERDVDMCFFVNEYIKKHDENGYDYKIFHNQTKEELFKHFKALQTDSSLRDYDSFFFVFLTYMFGEDDSKSKNCPRQKKSSKQKDERLHFLGDKVHLDEIYKEMDEIKELLTKPKVFLVQADSVELLKGKTIKKAAGKGLTQLVKIPHDADRVTILSTIPGKDFVSGDKPSFLIQTFVDVMNANKEASPQLDFLSLSAVINNKVDEMIDDWRKRDDPEEQTELHVPLVTTTLTKLLFFRGINSGLKT